MISDFNRKKMILIKQQLCLFEKRSIDLGKLIDDLDVLYRMMTLFDSKWEDEFFQTWLNLESIYAGMLIRKSKELENKEVDIINKSIEKLNELVDIHLSNYTKTPDLSVSQRATLLNNDWLLCPNCIDAWETASNDAMVICPKCNNAFHNPRYQNH
ncbi:MAG: hypothetical protein ACM3JI_02680 [Anaerolineae bacterium]